jgi:hypothetical protein
MGVGTKKDDSKNFQYHLAIETPVFPFHVGRLPIFIWFYAGFELVLTRKMSFYVVTYYLPSGLFVIVSWIREHQILDQLRNISEKGFGVAHGPKI